MDLTGIRDAIHDEITKVLREVGASAPAHDLDTIAHHIVTALDNFTAEPAETDDHDGGGAEAAPGDETEHPSDVEVAATADDIAAGKVIEPAEGGHVVPANE